MTQERYAVLSLELHMFFARIMMENTLFLESRLMPASSELSQTAAWYKKQFEAVLHNAVILGDGVVSPEVLASGEMVTAYTLASEQLTQYFLDIEINQDITKMQEELRGSENPEITPTLIAQVRQLSEAVQPLIGGMIEYKNRALVDLQTCRVFIAEYPLIVRTMLGQINDYSNRFSALESGRENYDTQDILLFWTQGILERVLSLRHMFDPTEKEMMAIADGFAHRYFSLMQETRMMSDTLTPRILDTALKEAIDYRDFSETVVKMMVDCKIQSSMLPQMADHALRETNYFIRMLKKQAAVS